MGDFNGWAPGGGIPVERKQSMPPKGIDDFADGVVVQVEGFQFAPSGAAARVVGVFVNCDQSEQYLACGLVTVPRKILIDLLGTTPQRSGDATNPVVVGARQRIGASGLDQLGEGVLHEWEATGLLGNVAGDPSRQAWFKAKPHRLGGFLDGLGEFLASRRNDGDMAGTDVGSYVLIRKGSVEEVGSHRE